MREKPQQPGDGTDPAKARGVRSILLSGVFRRIIIIEAVLLVWSVGWRAYNMGGTPAELAWYALRIIALVGVIVAFMFLTLRGFLRRRIIEPLEALVLANEQLGEDFEANDFQLPPGAPREMVDIAASRARMLSRILEVSNERLKLYRFLKKTFGLYVSNGVVDEILSSPEGPRVGGHRQTVTVLFADLRGFTAMSAHHEPEVIFGLLNRWLAAMSAVLEEFEGAIIDVLGDEIMAVFGITGHRPDDVDRAVACGLKMQNVMAELNLQLEAEKLPRLEMGVGINTGSVLLGNIGSDRRLKYGIVGSPVNQAARIQTTAVGGQVLISQATHQAVTTDLIAPEHHSVLVKGLERALTVHEVQAIGAPFNVSLTPEQAPLPNFSLDAPLKWWSIEDKQLIEPARPGRVMEMNDVEMLVSLDTEDGRPLPRLTDLKLALDGQGLNHDFEDIYAKVIRDEDTPGGAPAVNHLRITALADEDRELICRLAEERGRA